MAVNPQASQELFATPAVSLLTRPDGSMIMSARQTCPPAVPGVGHWLKHWAEHEPDTVFLGERLQADAPWTTVSYRQAWRAARAVGAWLLAQQVSVERPVVILSDNAIDHALLALGAMLTGVPVATISSAYSLISSDHAKLRAMIRLLTPRVIYVADSHRYAAALQAIEPDHQALLVSSTGNPPGTIAFSTLTECADESAVDTAMAGVTGDTIARFLFTSGSTGAPKAVINTHRMLCVSQEAKAQVWPFLEHTPPVIVDWLPWSHTFGANHNFNMVLRNGGTLYIDGGRPAPQLADITATNIAEIGPNICFNVPRGYDMLVSALRANETLRQRFFATVKIIFYAGAALPQPVWEALRELSLQTTGQVTPMVSAWGSTETSPLATDCHFQAERSGNIGVPVPGVDLKLVPNGDKLEIRVRGPNVTPGYWRQPAATAAAFDDEGFYRIGDAVRLADPEHPEQGLYFDGRVAEDFKLASGTFVNVGQLRLDALSALAPLAQDIVLTGHDRDEVGLLVFPNGAACRSLSGLDQPAPLREVLDHPAVRSHIANGMSKLRNQGGGSSRYATRARLLETPASVDAGEITDKGYINQRAVLDNRAADIALMRGADPGAYIALPPS